MLVGRIQFCKPREGAHNDGTSWSREWLPSPPTVFQAERAPRFTARESQLTVLIMWSGLMPGRRSLVSAQSVLEITHCGHTLSAPQILFVLRQPSPSPAHGVWILRTAHPRLVGGLICIEVGRQGLTSTSRSLSKHPGRKIPSLLGALTSSSGASSC